MTKTIINYAKFTFLVFMMGLGLSNCSGSGNSDHATNNNYFRFTMNGIETDYSQHKNTRATLSFVKSRNKHVSFSVTGYDKNKTENSAGPALSILINASITNNNGEWTGIDITTGTYSAVYNEGYSLGCNYYITGLDNYTIKDDNFILNINVLTKTQAQGTFSGVLEDHNGQQIVITNGEFSVGVKYTETAN